MFMDNLCPNLGNISPFSWLLNAVSPFKYIYSVDDAPGDDAPDDDEDDKPVDDKPVDDKPVDTKTGHFAEGFSEDVKKHPSVLKFKNTEDMAKSYINLETKIGSKGIIVPGKDAKPEEVNAFHEALGRYTDPEKVEVAELPKDIDSRIIQDDNTKKAFKDLAVGLHLDKEQAQGLQKWWLDYNKSNLKAFDESMEKERNEAMTALNKEWGAKTEENVSKAAKVAQLFGGKEAIAWLEKGEGNNPLVVKMLANIANKIGEDTLGVKGSGGLTKTPAQAKSEIQQIRDNPKHPFNDGNHRDHKEAVEYMTSLYAMAHLE